MRVSPVKRRCLSLMLILTLLLLTLSAIHAQDSSLKETFDNLALPGWERSPGTPPGKTS